MAWHLVDHEGHEGVVREDLSLAYSGDADIFGMIERYAAEREAGPQGNEDVVQTVMVQLYVDGRARKAERVNDVATVAQPVSPRLN